MSRQEDTSDVHQPVTGHFHQACPPAQGINRVQMRWAGICMTARYWIASNYDPHFSLQSALLKSTRETTLQPATSGGGSWAGSTIPGLYRDNNHISRSRLLRVLQRLKDFGLKLLLEKCKFFQASVRYLGHIVSEQGVATDPEKISALKSWPVPRTLKELRSFLGFAGYYRRFIHGYAAIAKPLNHLTKGYTPSRHPGRKGLSSPRYCMSPNSLSMRDGPQNANLPSKLSLTD